MHRYSCRRVRASRTARERLASSVRLSRIGRHSGPSFGLRRTAQGELVLARELLDLVGARLGHLTGIDARDAHAIAVNVEHDARRAGEVVSEDRLQDPHDELHRGVVVVVQQYLVGPGPGDLLLRPDLGDDPGLVTGGSLAHASPTIKTGTPISSNRRCWRTMYGLDMWSAWTSQRLWPS